MAIIYEITEDEPTQLPDMVAVVVAISMLPLLNWLHVAIAVFIDPTALIQRDISFGITSTVLLVIWIGGDHPAIGE